MRRIVGFLQERGIRVWLDNERLSPGTPVWEEEIEKAINAASAVVAVMSPDSKNSEWVRREISLADQNHKQIFPVLVRGDEDTSITLRLITRQYVDMRENEADGLSSLYAALSNYLSELPSQTPQGVAVESVAADQNAGYASPDLGARKKLSGGEATWIPVAWAIAGAIGGFLYSDFNTIVGGLIGGAIGGGIMLLTMRPMHASAVPKNTFWIPVVWAIAGAIGWTIGEELTEAIGMGIGYAILAGIAISITIRLQHLVINWMNFAWIILSWAISGMIGWSIGRYIQENNVLDWATGWAIGYALSWAIAGFVTVRQMRQMNS